MNIALVSQEYPPETAKGGIGSQTYTKAHGLASLGHQVHVISRSTDGNRHDYEDGPVAVTRISGMEYSMDIYTEIGDWITYSAQIAQVIESVHKKTPLNLVEFPEWAAEGYVHLLNRSEWNHIPTAIHLHGPLVMFTRTMGWPELDSTHYRVGTFMESTCLKLADAVFSSSKCSIDWCAEHYGLDPRGVPIIHTGVDRSLFYPRPTPLSSRPTIIFVGKIVDNKGVRELVASACQLAQEIPDLCLQLIGRGPEKVVKELRQYAKARNLNNLIDLPGFVSREDLPDFLSRAHVFAAPSIYEGGPGFVYLEAMACGLPVIACEGSGASEVVAERGLLVPPSDIEALTESLRHLLTDESLRLSLVEKGKSYVKDYADSKQCIERLASFYSAVSKGKVWKEVA